MAITWTVSFIIGIAYLALRFTSDRNTESNIIILSIRLFTTSFVASGFFFFCFRSGISFHALYESYGHALWISLLMTGLPLAVQEVAIEDDWYFTVEIMIDSFLVILMEFIKRSPHEEIRYVSPT
jgi:hypothetical protein